MGNISKKGSATAYVLSIMTIVLFILTPMLQYISSSLRYSMHESSREEALQIAEAGMYWYKWYLSHHLAGKTAQQTKQFWSDECGGNAKKQYDATEYIDPYGSGIGRYQIEIDCPTEYLTIVTVRSSAWTYKNTSLTRTVQARFRKPSWSEYAVLSNVETSFVRFGSDTEVFGPVHANGGIHFDGVAHNTITSSAETYYDSDTDVHAWRDGVWTSWNNEYNSTQNSNVFLGGKEYPVTPPKDFNGVTTDLSVIKDAAIASETYFDSTSQGRRIILKPNGTFDMCIVNSYNGSTNAIGNYKRWSSNGTCSSCSGQCLRNFSIPQNGAIFVEDNIWLEGTVDGNRVTIAAADMSSSQERSIFVGYGDLRYTNYDGSDIIGVIGEKNVEVIGPSLNVLRIDGAFLAQTGRVGREHYTPAGCNGSCAVIRDTITVYGAIATNLRYGFAWTDGTGYQHKNLYFDNNLLYYPPPYFPVGTDYFIDLWEEI